MIVLIFFLIALFLLILTHTFWILSFNKRQLTNFSFVRFFPYELNPFRRNEKTGVFGAVLMGISLVALIAPVVIFSINIGFLSAYLFMAMFIVTVGVYFALLFVKLTNFRGHVMCASLFVALVIGLILVEFLIFGSPQYGYMPNIMDYRHYIIYTIHGLSLIFELILVLNPKHKEWGKLIKENEEKYVRPKFNYFATLEWGTFINLIVCEIPLIIIYFSK